MSMKRLSVKAVMVMGLVMAGGAAQADLLPPDGKPVEKTCTIELVEKAGNKECETCWQSFGGASENCETKFPGATKVCEERQGAGNNQIWCKAPAKVEEAAAPAVEPAKVEEVKAEVKAEAPAPAAAPAAEKKSGCEGAGAGLLSLLALPMLFRRRA